MEHGAKKSDIITQCTTEIISTFMFMYIMATMKLKLTATKLVPSIIASPLNPFKH